VNCSSPAAYTPKHLADKILTSRVALEGERKQVTGLFCDIVESSRLAERLDPEAMHEIWVWRRRRRLQFSRPLGYLSSASALSSQYVMPISRYIAVAAARYSCACPRFSVRR